MDDIQVDKVHYAHVQPPIVKMVVNTNDTLEIDDCGNEIRMQTITFSFNTKDIEVVRTRDKAWLIREKK
jgi:hypothetical protein